jgi:UDP-N-acetyl-D-glucosamine dehydrogenase
LEDDQLVPQREVLKHEGALGPDTTEEACEDHGDHAGHHRAGRPKVNVDEADGVNGRHRAYKHILGFEDGDAVFKLSTAAIDVNDTRSLHVATLTRDALRNMGRHIAGAQVLICGASYRQDVGDTRYSGSEVVVRRLTEMGAEMRVHDPYVEHWYEFESQDTYPAPGQSLARFFRNQEHLVGLRVQHRLEQALAGAEAVILAVPHEAYLHLRPDDVVGMAGAPLAVIDCFGILDDARIRRYFELGCEVKGLGRGHIQQLKMEQREGR